MGMLVSKILWLTLTYLAPNNSMVMGAAIVMMAPVHAPITAVEMYRQIIDEWSSKKKAAAKGGMNVATYAGLVILILYLRTNSS